MHTRLICASIKFTYLQWFLNFLWLKQLKHCNVCGNVTQQPRRRCSLRQMPCDSVYSSKHHSCESPWCWSQYRWHHVITGERVLDVEASTGDITWSQVRESLMLKPVQVTIRDHRWESLMLKPVQVTSRTGNITWSQVRESLVLKPVQVTSRTGNITWSQVKESLMLKPVQVTSRDHRWESPWRWSQNRCYDAHRCVSIFSVKLELLSRLARLRRTAESRSALPCWMTPP